MNRIFSISGCKLSQSRTCFLYVANQMEADDLHLFAGGLPDTI